jgi:ABC-2 type transport system permease protein
MRRWLRIVGLFWWTSLLAELEYRMNFLLATLSAGGHLLGNWFALTLFYHGGGSLGGWPFLDALLVMGIFTTLQGLIRTILTPNLTRLVEHVRTGTLDFVLLKPLDSQLWLSARRVSPWGLPDVAFGLGIIGYVTHRLDLQPSRLLFALGPFLCSMVILYALWFAFASIAIWYVKVYNVTEVLNSLISAGRYPIDAMPSGVYRFVFTFVLPVSLLTTLPAKTALGLPLGASFGWAVLVAAFALAASRAFWRFALRYYTSASS